MADDITLGEIRRSLERIEKKLDQVALDHEQRIRRTERIMHASLGLALAGAGTGVTGLLSLVGG